MRATQSLVRAIYDRKNKKMTLQYVARGKLPRESLSSMRPIRYKSSDGLEIPAYLTLPKGLSGKSLPTIIVPHGGPGLVISGATTHWRNSLPIVAMPCMLQTSVALLAMARSS